MKFSLGCLTGVIAGLLFAILLFVGYTLMTSRGTDALFPAAPTADADLTVTVSKAYMVDQMKQTMSSHGLQASNPTFDVYPPNKGRASMDLEFNLLGANLRIRPQVDVHYGVDKGDIFFAIDKVNVAGFDVPQDMVNAQASNIMQVTEDDLNANIHQWLSGTGLRIQSLEASNDGKMIVKLGK